MALVIQLEVDDKGTPKIVRFEDSVKSLDNKIKKSNATVQKQGSVFKRLGGSVKSTAASFRGFATVAKIGVKVLAGMAVAVGGIIFALDRLFKSVVQISAIKLGFEQMAAAVGGANVVLRDSQNATKGLVSELDLMRQFNNAVALGVVDTSKQFANLTGAALTLGRALGVGPQRAIDSLVIGIGRQSRLMLDNLGIIVSVEEANRKFAASLGIAVSELTLSQRQTSFKLEADVKLQAAMESLGGIVLSAADQWQVLKISLTDTVNEFQVGIGDSKVLATFLDRLSVVAGRLTGDFDSNNIAMEFTGKVVKSLVNAVAFLLKALGFILIFIDPVVLGFNILVRTIINLVRIALAPLLIAFAGIITGLNAIGQVSDETVVAVNNFVEGMITMNDFLPESANQTASFAEQALIAADSFSQMAVELDKLSNSTSTLSDEQKAQSEQMKIILKFTKALLADTESLNAAFGISGVSSLNEYIDTLIKEQNIILDSVKLKDLQSRALELVTDKTLSAKDALKALAVAQKESEARWLKLSGVTMAFFDALTKDDPARVMIEAIFKINEAFERFEEQRQGENLFQKALGTFDAANVNKQVLDFFGTVEEAFANAPTDLINATMDSLSSGFTQLGEALGGGEKFDAKKILGGLFSAIGAIAINLGTMAILAAALGLTAPLLFEAIAPASLLPLGLALVAFGVGLTAAGAALSRGGSKGSGGGDQSETQQRRQRDRSRQQGGDELGQANVILIGDFFGTPEFAQKIATDISKQVGKNRLNLEASDSILAAQIND